MLISYNVSLKPYNTFGMAVNADKFIRISSTEQLLEVIDLGLEPLWILGGGSNVLLTGDLPGYILKNEIRGITIIHETDEELTVEAGAGEIWHEFVLWAISRGLGGIENLALIPGTVGAAPIQNIGAYGLEQESVFTCLKAINLKDGSEKIFSREECRFGYRNSVFKQECKGRYFITYVTYTLRKNGHTLNTSYGAIVEKLHEKGIQNPDIADVAEAVIDIRRSKLPDPAEIGNAGSFFKNPVIKEGHYLQLKKDYPEIPSYPADAGFVKIPAGWLIEKAGFKGIRRGDVGVHKNQALVLVNYGAGTGKEIVELAEDISETILQKFKVSIEAEVNIWK